MMDLNELKKWVKEIPDKYAPKDGWIKVYEKNPSNDIQGSIRSYIAKSEVINYEQPFSDIDNNFNYPSIPIIMPSASEPAKVLVIEIKDRRDGSVHPELNQSIKIDMGLLEEKSNCNNVIYKKVKDDKSTEKILLKTNHLFRARWIDINELLTNEECLILYFYFEFKCKSEVFDNLKDGLKIVRLPKKGIIYERTVKKPALVRILGKKIIEKKFIEQPIYYLFKIGYHPNGSIKYAKACKNDNSHEFQACCVYFDRKVLQKYEQSQYFDVDALRLSAEGWSLKIHNNKPQIISILFKHLIEHLPEGEYLHWMAYNILPAPEDLGLTPGEHATTVKGIPHQPDRSDHRFKWALKKYYQLEHHPLKKIILKQLNPSDKPYFNTLNLISERSQWHFDLQVLCLCKIIIESINTDELCKRGIKKYQIAQKENKEEKREKKSKNMLKEYLESKSKLENEFDYAGFLDNLYKVRLGVAHRRKSKTDSDYDVGLNFFKKKYGDNLVDILDGIFHESCQLIELINKIDMAHATQD